MIIPVAVPNSLISDVKKRIFACKLSDDFSGFVNTYGTGKRNHAGALVLWNKKIQQHTWIMWIMHVYLHPAHQ